MSKAVLFFLVTAFCFSSSLAAEETPLWQVSTPTTTWKASGSQLWITTQSGTQELTVSKSSLRYFRDQVSELSTEKTDENQCSAYAEFHSTFGVRKICEPALHADSKAVTLLSRLKKLSKG